MNKIISYIIDIVLTIVLMLTIQTVAFSSMMYIFEFFKDELVLEIYISLLSLAIVACLAQVWVFLYFIAGINILKYKEKKK